MHRLAYKIPPSDQAKATMLLELFVQVIKLINVHAAKSNEIRKSNLLTSEFLLLRKTNRPTISVIIILEK